MRGGAIVVGPAVVFGSVVLAVGWAAWRCRPRRSRDTILGPRPMDGRRP